MSSPFFRQVSLVTLRAIEELQEIVDGVVVPPQVRGFVLVSIPTFWLLFRSIIFGTQVTRSTTLLVASGCPIPGGICTQAGSVSVPLKKCHRLEVGVQFAWGRTVESTSIDSEG